MNRFVVVLCSLSVLLFSVAVGFAAECSYTMMPTEKQFGPEGGEGQIMVTASDSSCNWRSWSDESWIFAPCP